MGTHKRTKLPLDVSQENSKDMFKLKFIRKSEMEPTVRHHLKQAVSQMDKQLDVWYKEQTFTIGTISKQQDKLAQSRKRLKKEQRKIKKKEYARQQEEIRSKLHALRLRIMLRKAVQKFKSNVVRAREYKNAELDKLGPNLRRPVSDAVIATSITNKMATNKDVVTVVDMGAENAVTGLKRFPSSGGRQMEPIPEEIELDVDDIEKAERQSKGLTKRHLHKLNRTMSTRTVLDIRATVPLLPDLHPRSNRHNRKSGSSDTDDKETQDSLETEHGNFPGIEDQTERVKKKTKSTVVKLPVASKSPQLTRTPRAENLKTSRSDSLQSIKSLKASVRGVHGSDTELSDNDTESGDSNASVADFLSEDESWDNTSDYESSYSVEDFIPEEISLTLTRYKRKGWKKTIDSKKIEEAHPHRQNFPDERILPELALLSDSKHRHIQNPYLSLYKERSFYIDTKSKDNVTDSTTDNTLSSKDDLYINTSQISKVKDKDKADVTVHESKENQSVTQDEATQDMTVFGKKADYNARKQLKTPPNTPASQFTATKVSPRSHISVAAMNKKRAQSLDKHQTSQSLDEPFQRYGKNRTGKLIAVGSPKAHHTELPSMREQYKRDKLLKMERDTQLNQHMKMERFFSSFDKDQLDLPTPSGYPPSKLTPLPDRRHGDRSKAFTNFVFKIMGPENEDSYLQKEIVPGAETTSVRLLRNCRYLREYKPLSREDNLVYPIEKETSWQMKTSYNDKYLANVRLKLF